MDSVGAAAAIPETNNENEKKNKKREKEKKTQLKISISSEEIKCTVLISSSANVLREVEKNIVGIQDCSRQGKQKNKTKKTLTHHQQQQLQTVECGKARKK